MGFTHYTKAPYTVFSLKVIVVLLLLLTAFSVSAQTSSAVTDRQAQLQAQLDEVEKEIVAGQIVLENTQKQTGSIERDLAVLDAKIAQAKLVIKAKTLTIEQLGKDITAKSNTIETLSEKISNSQSSLQQLIKKTNQIDNISLAEVMLGSDNLSDVFSDLDSFDTLKKSLYSVYQDTKDTRQLTETQKEDLDKRRKAELNAQQEIQAQQRAIQSDESQKQVLLTLSKNQEKAYQDELDQKNARAAAIRSALFGLRDTAAIPFGTALELATVASTKTGVRPAFLLAILTQETNLGQNIGTCNRDGDPASKSYKVIMPGPLDKASGKSSRDDQTVFLQITHDLGLDPNTTPLSCPWQGGWGGAMGPSQFIPTTWKAFVPQLQQLLGVTTPDPWKPGDAFMASAIYLAQLGADDNSYASEREAALRYYAGSAWNKPQNAFYGNQVMAKAANIQENMIDPLKGL